jgi:isopentenyl phosphate kinase
VLVEQIQQNLLFLDKILQEIFADWRGAILVPRLDIEDGKVRVVSGDEILVDLAKKSGADLVLIASDVPGVYLGDELKTEFNVSQIPLLLEQMTTIEDNRIDVTGGMLGKLNSLRELADSVLVRFV